MSRSERRISIREAHEPRPWTACGTAANDLPGWVARMVQLGATLSSHAIPTVELRGEDLTQAARVAFLHCVDALPGSPCRMWAFLPRPTDRDGDALERYMRFNAGRASAFRSRPERISVIPAGTCVGHAGTDLVVHALHQPFPMHAVENPRQRSAWLYSEQFGPVSPCFTRGVVTNGMLLASGTASVVGEQSLHQGDLAAQFAEAVDNLDALATVCGTCGPWRSVQVYARDLHALPRVERLAQQAFHGGLERVLCAPLCRAELLVEIEGVADVM